MHKEWQQPFRMYFGGGPTPIVYPLDLSEKVKEVKIILMKYTYFHAETRFWSSRSCWVFLLLSFPSQIASAITFCSQRNSVLKLELLRLNVWIQCLNSNTAFLQVLFCSLSCFILLKVRDRFELKSPVKTIEDFIRRLTPSRLTSGSNSSSSSSLATNKSMHRFGLSILSSTSTESTLLKLEEKLAYSAQMNNNGYSSQQGRMAVGSGPEEGELRYEAESPDEAALVYAARAYNCSLVGRLSDQVSVELPHLGTLNFEVLHTLGFDSIRKRMSVVVRHPLTDEINVYTKGADSVIMDLLLPCSSGTPLSFVRVGVWGGGSP